MDFHLQWSFNTEDRNSQVLHSTIGIHYTITPLMKLSKAASDECGWWMVCHVGLNTLQALLAWNMLRLLLENHECQVKTLHTQRFLRLILVWQAGTALLMCPFSVSVFTLLYPNVFSSFNPWFMPLSDHTDRTLALTSFPSEGLNVAPEGLAGTGCCLMTVFTVYWLSGSARAPPLGTSLNNLTGFTELEGGKEAGPVLGVFLLKQTGSIREWMAPTGSSSRPVQVFVAPAVQFRLDYSHCSMTSFALSVSSFR